MFFINVHNHVLFSIMLSKTKFITKNACFWKIGLKISLKFKIRYIRWANVFKKKFLSDDSIFSFLVRIVKIFFLRSFSLTWATVQWSLIIIKIMKCRHIILIVALSAIMKLKLSIGFFVPLIPVNFWNF